MATGTKAQQQAAEAAFMSARDAASVAGQAAADAAAQASVAAQAATEAEAVASAAATEVASAASDAEKLHQADATRAAQEATLAALQEIEATPGGSTWDAWRAQAAIEQVKAEMEGRSFDGQFGSSYDDAMKEIDRMEKSGKSAVECISQSGC